MLIRRARRCPGSARNSCQKSPSQPSRTRPLPWASTSRTVTRPAGAPARKARWSPSRSSSRSRPSSTSCSIAVAVKVFEWEAMRKRCEVVSATPVLDVGVAVRRGEDEPVLVEDGDLDAGHTIESLPERRSSRRRSGRVVDRGGRELLHGDESGPRERRASSGVRWAPCRPARSAQRVLEALHGAAHHAERVRRPLGRRDHVVGRAGQQDVGRARATGWPPNGCSPS